jgi:hypothetical protein
MTPLEGSFGAETAKVANELKDPTRIEIYHLLDMILKYEMCSPFSLRSFSLLRCGPPRPQG